jgi:electron transfer flavoprotein-quinone oxidoreductase
MADEKFDAIVVGAGLAGTAAALTMARTGMQVLVVEKGKTPGSKNVTGGRMYSHALAKLVPDFWEHGAPIERWVTKEVITMLTKDDALNIAFDAPKMGSHHISFNVLRARFDPWFAKQAEAAGALVATDTRVDDLLLEGGVCKGIVTGGEAFKADAVVLAEGANTLLTEKSGIRGPSNPKTLAVGVKETVALSPETINDRFGIGDDEGVAQVILGTFTRGIEGGGFLYTNRDSVSFGLVMPIAAGIEGGQNVYDIIEDLRTHPHFAKLFKGGEIREYSAHMVPERGIEGVPKSLVRDGLVVAGDSAGFVLNSGLTFRGMDFAIESGRLAGQAIAEAKKGHGNFTAEGLRSYEAALEDSFVMKDLKRFKHAHKVTGNPRMFTTYPEMVMELLHNLYDIRGEQPKPSAVVTKTLRKHVSMATLAKDAITGRMAM